MYFVPGAKYTEELQEGSRVGLWDPVSFSVGFGLVRSSRFAGSLFFGLVFDLVDLAVGGGSRIDHAAGADFERLHLKFLRLKNDGGLAVGRDAVYARGRSCRGVYVAGFVGATAQM